MVITQLSTETMQQVQRLLEQMNACAQELESIAQIEYEAIRGLDAEQIMQCSDSRSSVHQYLSQLEQQCRELLSRHNIDAEMTLSVIIDMYAAGQAGDFQALRRSLYERMLKVNQQSQENRLRLHAAYNVSSSILQSLGLSQSEQTYKRRMIG